MAEYRGTFDVERGAMSLVKLAISPHPDLPAHVILSGLAASANPTVSYPSWHVSSRIWKAGRRSRPSRHGYATTSTIGWATSSG